MPGPGEELLNVIQDQLWGLPDERLLGSWQLHQVRPGDVTGEVLAMGKGHKGRVSSVQDQRWRLDQGSRGRASIAASARCSAAMAPGGAIARWNLANHRRNRSSPERLGTMLAAMGTGVELGHDGGLLGANRIQHHCQLSSPRLPWWEQHTRLGEESVHHPASGCRSAPRPGWSRSARPTRSPGSWSCSPPPPSSDRLPGRRPPPRSASDYRRAALLLATVGRAHRARGHPGRRRPRRSRPLGRRREGHGRSSALMARRSSMAR
jgi:hypothetical protein